MIVEPSFIDCLNYNSCLDLLSKQNIHIKLRNKLIASQIHHKFAAKMNEVLFGSIPRYSILSQVNLLKKQKRTTHHHGQTVLCQFVSC